MEYDLTRFIKAQEEDYGIALLEIKNGEKRSHWIWYIFPQLKGLGTSSMSEYYGISGLSEAKAYMENPVLGERLLEITNTLLAINSSDPLKIMGYPDNLKLKSSLTLFSIAVPEYGVFQKALDKFFNGEKDPATIRVLEKNMD